MKLKRFLLKYDPPGIGLVVKAASGQEDSPDETIHKDLPALADVSSAEDIQRIADGLIAEEPSMLTRRKHRPALLKLLGRLYQVEVSLEDRKAGVEKSPESPAAIQEGHSVVLIQLQGKHREHNGEIATVQRAKPDKDKYEVALPSSEVIEVKGVKNIVPLAPQGTPLAIGTHVVIRRLKNHMELNGCLGCITKCSEEMQRFEVAAVGSNQLFRVKQDNLLAVSPLEAQRAEGAAERAEENGENNAGAANKAAPPAPPVPAEPAAGVEGNGGGLEQVEQGSTVQLHGLKSAANFNGQTAEVLSVDHARNRFEIKLANGSVKTIRAENVVLVSGPPKRK